METLKALDIVIITYVTDHIDLTTTHLYGARDLANEEVSEQAYKCIRANHPQGEDAMEGFEVLNIAR